VRNPSKQTKRPPAAVFLFASNNKFDRKIQHDKIKSMAKKTKEYSITDFGVLLEDTNKTVNILAENHLDLVSRMDRIETKVDTLDTKVEELDTKVGILDTKVGILDTRVGDIETKLDTIDSRLRNVEIDVVQIKEDMLTKLELKEIQRRIYRLEEKTV